jgi:hypothetical protein
VANATLIRHGRASISGNRREITFETIARINGGATFP